MSLNPVQRSSPPSHTNSSSISSGPTQQQPSLVSVAQDQLTAHPQAKLKNFTILAFFLFPFIKTAEFFQFTFNLLFCRKKGGNETQARPQPTPIVTTQPPTPATPGIAPTPVSINPTTPSVTVPTPPLELPRTPLPFTDEPTPPPSQALIDLCGNRTINRQELNTLSINPVTQLKEELQPSIGTVTDFNELLALFDTVYPAPQSPETTSIRALVVQLVDQDRTRNHMGGEDTKLLILALRKQDIPLPRKVNAFGTLAEELRSHFSPPRPSTPGVADQRVDHRNQGISKAFATLAITPRSPIVPEILKSHYKMIERAFRAHYNLPHHLYNSFLDEILIEMGNEIGGYAAIHARNLARLRAEESAHGYGHRMHSLPGTRQERLEILNRVNTPANFIQNIKRDLLNRSNFVEFIRDNLRASNLTDQQIQERQGLYHQGNYLTDEGAMFILCQLNLIV